MVSSDETPLNTVNNYRLPFSGKPVYTVPIVAQINRQIGMAELDKLSAVNECSKTTGVKDAFAEQVITVF